MSIELPIAEVMMAVADLCIKLGAAPVNQYPACWEHQVDGEWWIALNGHKEPVKCSKGMEVDPFHMYVEFNGWPAGVLSTAGGVLAAGELANEAALLLALKRATPGGGK